MRYGSTDVFYKRHEGKGDSIVLLHGWGASSAAMDGIYNYLVSLGKDVIALDFPGFGQSDFPPATWGIYEYADCVQYILGELGIIKPIVIGHSFGGRVALILGARKLASKLVLADAAGLKPRYSIRKAIAVRKYKAAKRRGKPPQNAGSADYNALPPAMKSVFVRIVNTHLDGLLSQIDVPTLIFWGKNDTDTPPYMAYKLHKRIRDSGLVMLESAGHFAYAERHAVFCGAVRSFTEKE